MTHIRLFLYSIPFGLALCSGATAASSDWVEAAGGRLRLVVAETPHENGKLRGTLEIDLKPGWKTYWRDPGDAGVPPSIDVSASTGIRSATLKFPAPERHHDGAFSWAGYQGPVKLPVDFAFDTQAMRELIHASVFVGMCEAICVPVNADFTIDPANNADETNDDTVVAEAFDALPAPASEKFGLQIIEKKDNFVTVKAVSPEGVEASDIFLASDEGYYFKTPQKMQRDDGTYFTFEMTKPDSTPAGDGLHYTLTTTKGAVSGVLPYF